MRSTVIGLPDGLKINSCEKSSWTVIHLEYDNFYTQKDFSLCPK
jgi:hypothetical protein